MSFEIPENNMGGKENKVAVTPSFSGQAESDTPVYQPLNPRYIRLLKLLPGSGPDPIRIQLQSTSLEESGPYTALSYVWGDAKVDRRTIYSGDTELSVTANLFHALCRFRLQIWSHRLKLRRMLGPLIADTKEKRQEDDPAWSSTEAGAPKLFIITENKFFGTGLPGVEVGDVVAILAGSGNPWYLRKQGEHYIVIGKGWIHCIVTKRFRNSKIPLLA
ncbi:hypothetical protein V8C34DRAFT_316186 [Trichoderma compactum]